MMGKLVGLVGNHRAVAGKCDQLESDGQSKCPNGPVTGLIFFLLFAGQISLLSPPCIILVCLGETASALFGNFGNFGPIIC